MVNKSISKQHFTIPQTDTYFVALSDRHFHCPECGSRKLYTLADGRRKCKQCERKFTPRPQRHKLSKGMIKEIVRLFWLMVPASRVAKDLKINRKTVFTYYTKLRNLIAE